MSDSIDAPQRRKRRFVWEFVGLWFGILSGGISAAVAMYHEIMESIRMEKWWTVPFWFYAYASVLFVAWLFRRQTMAESAELRARLIAMSDTRKIRELIGQLLANGNQLMVVIQRDGPLPVKEAQDWMDNAATEIGKLLDSSYVARFHSPAGVGLPDLENNPRNRLSTAIHFRLTRLNQFLAELAPRIPSQPDSEV